MVGKEDKPLLEEITEGEYRLLMHGAINASLQEAREYVSQVNGIDEAKGNGYGVRFYKQGGSVLYRVFRKPRVGF